METLSDSKNGWLAIPDEDAIIAFARELMLTRYMAVAGCALLFYEWITTLDDEIAHIWPAKWSATKIIFLVNRYVNLGLQLAMICQFIGLTKVSGHATCVSYIIGYGIAVFLSLASVHVLALVRAWVIWGRRLWITLILASAYVLYALVCTALIIYASITVRSEILPWD
ncbi:hypothetical protein BDQ12DRAFT_709590 [Crucibulum laeve]|uniref:DUF6533 domain-containing protein n=1 Tax=Crucibulum laeve TaxID=68775 RepID=A0A5C3MET5_9AGAR|nr:hypothetical protein BDQ12DRAFT_709590 [Crucibulum laeve]